MRFLLGPAGSGKTFRCLAEIRAQLLAAPDGPPLVLLAPKQATFQLERQLLCDEALAGYTRLQILSFERLADFILKQSGFPAPPLLSEQGRVMVLRTLLKDWRKNLRVFRGETGLTGFARQLSLDLRELQCHQLSPAALAKLAETSGLPGSLRNKLHDLGLMLGAYLEWLASHKLGDADCLLDIAARELRVSIHGAGGSRNWQTRGLPHKGVASQGMFLFSDLSSPAARAPMRIAELWLDGFAEMTPQEISLLAALAPCCESLTLAFCVEPVAAAAAGSWLSIWSSVNKTATNCRTRLEALPGAQIETVALPENHPTRFSENPVLAHLERHWSQPTPFAGDASATIRLALCSNPQAEAVLAAREILRFARAGGRFRDAAILLRRMEGYHDEVRRALTHYGIPFFLDRREAVAHHPLAELTRYALGALAFSWLHDDWFGALKTGLVTNDERAVDQLENEALARGWKGEAWLSPFGGENTETINRWRERWIAPFLELKKALTIDSRLEPTGKQLAGGLRSFWRRLKVERTLEEWSKSGGLEPAESPGVAPHATVWEQLNAWLDDVELAFADESLPLTEWLPILEAGLSGLSVGLIPPALDQVLVGAVDRSRNPDLKLALVLGVNETVFPGAQPSVTLLVESDRDELEKCGVCLGPNTRQWLSRERFLGYIACTRSQARLTLSGSLRDATDATLNPSPFFSHLKALFPSLVVENFQGMPAPAQAEHACELAAPFLRAISTFGADAGGWTRWPVFDPLRDSLKTLFEGSVNLSPEIAQALYGKELKTSVSRLEQFAACPFQFFIASGLRAEERQLFELDAREKGTFQHAVLAEFHARLRAEGRRWHDLTPLDARHRIGTISTELATGFHDGLLSADAPSRFAARAMTRSLQDFIATIIGWMSQYEFEPEQVELEFGRNEQGLPGWNLDLGAGNRLVFRGVIDRIDLCPVDETTALAVVIDYKSSAKKLDRAMLDNGLQLQLPAYLSVLRSLKDPSNHFRFKRLIPVGVFYADFNGKFDKGNTRVEVLEGLETASQSAYQHSGRFDFSALRQLDNRREPSGTQFKYRLTKTGEPYKKSSDVMASETFQQMLDQVETHLLRMGREIFSGCSRLDPYQKGNLRACDRCDFKSICRIDPWTHKFRMLGKSALEPSETIN